MIRGEKLRGWTAEQMMFIHALHTFATVLLRRQRQDHRV
jgi:hypothetical protein